ncbi:MAG: hypothetical protein IAF02_25195 [Anaerolineae bacterium]|nr:hypothetical protein [Anaerolineae bacterium]
MKNIIIWFVLLLMVGLLVACGADAQDIAATATAIPDVIAAQPTLTATPKSAVGVTVTAVAIEQPPQPSPVPTEEDVEWEGDDEELTGTVEEIYLAALQKQAQQPARSIETVMYAADGTEMYHQIVSYIPPDRFRRWQGSEAQWQDAITIGSTSYVSGTGADWTKLEGKTDPVADLASAEFAAPPTSLEDASAAFTQVMATLGITDPVLEMSDAGQDTLNGQPMRLLTQNLKNGDGEILMSVQLWIGVADGLPYRSETQLTPEFLAGLSGDMAQIASFMGHTIMIYAYDFEIEAPIP